MNKLLIFSLAAIFLIACNNDETTEKKDNSSDNNLLKSTENSYHIDKEESVLVWEGTMVGLYSHEGTMHFKESELTLKNGKVTSGMFTIDMNSMTATDDESNYVNAPREKLIAHLKADDFFAVDQFPVSSFKVISSEGEKIKGELTIRGITNEEEVTNVKITEHENSFSAEGKLIFDRQKYQVTYENKMGDMVLSDDIELTIKLKGQLKNNN